MIKAVIFDCFGVLTTDWWREFCNSLPLGAGLAKAKELNHKYDAGLISLSDFILGVQQATGREPKLVEAIFTSPEPVKNTKLLAYIKELSKNYKIGMISNIGTNWVTEHFLTLPEQELFDTMVFSFDVGTTKPDPKIYQYAAQKLSASPAECIFIDDVESYCQGAIAVGMHAVHYRDFDQTKKELKAILAAGADN